MKKITSCFVESSNVNKEVKDENKTHNNNRPEDQWPCKRSSDLDRFTCRGAYDPCPGTWPVCIPGAKVAGFIKRIIEHCYTQNVIAPGLTVSKKKILYAFPVVSIWEQLSPVVGPS